MQRRCNSRPYIIFHSTKEHSSNLYFLNLELNMTPVTTRDSNQLKSTSLFDRGFTEIIVITNEYQHKTDSVPVKARLHLQILLQF